MTPESCAFRFMKDLIDNGHISREEGKMLQWELESDIRKIVKESHKGSKPADVWPLLDASTKENEELHAEVERMTAQYESANRKLNTIVEMVKKERSAFQPCRGEHFARLLTCIEIIIKETTDVHFGFIMKCRLCENEVDVGATKKIL